LTTPSPPPRESSENLDSSELVFMGVPDVPQGPPSNVQRGIGREEGPVMKTVYLASQWLVWVLGAVEAAFGVMFWTGHGLSVYKPALLIGAVFVLSLWLLTAICARAGASTGVVTAGLVCGVFFAGLGLFQWNTLPDTPHWIVRAVHALLALGGIGVGSELVASANPRKLEWPDQRTPPVGAQ